MLTLIILMTLIALSYLTVTIIIGYYLACGQYNVCVFVCFFFQSVTLGTHGDNDTNVIWDNREKNKHSELTISLFFVCLFFLSCHTNLVVGIICYQFKCASLIQCKTIQKMKIIVFHPLKIICGHLTLRNKIVLHILTLV